MASRPTATVQSLDGKKAGQVALPAVFTAPIRADIIAQVHTNMAKNHRQPYAVSMRAGHQTAAESWGTGRAVSRIPRVPGGGTHRAGQAAFGNMCRGGHMFAPTKVWRRWHRKVNLKMKRYAVCSAIAASAVPALVMARGHRIDKIPEVPLVVDDALETISKTKAAVAALRAVGAGADLDKCAATKQIRTGKGKWRNRRYVTRKGPLVITSGAAPASKALRNIPGVEVACVESLNLLQLAPGGHMGRFCVWTKSAVEKLDDVFGTQTVASKQKKGWKVPAAPMVNSDLGRLINDDAIQSVVNPAKDGQAPAEQKLNPLRNRAAMVRLNPAWEKAAAAERAAKKQRKAKKGGDAKVSKAFYKQMIADSDYQGDKFDAFAGWLEKHLTEEKDNAPAE
ncbi:unnamed protein product [Pedinophyceae sp. YPF-701]|nr:unnamed protein product [Pedinophyceae sp. YPF-701]